MPKRFHSTLILAAVFVLGIAGGVAGMVWAWPGIRARYFHHQHPSFAQFLQKSLQVTPAQATQMVAIFKETDNRRHDIHLQFVPQYTRVCEDSMQAYTQIRTQEREAYGPVQQQELDKIRAMLTPSQWATFQKQRAAGMNQRQHDPCAHPEQGPGGDSGGRGGRGRNGRRGPPPGP